jgi:hypothetical protein
MWHCVDLVWSDVSEKRIASIFRVEKSVSKEPEWAVRSHLLILVRRSRISTLKMESIYSCEKSVYTRSTRRQIPKDGILQYIFRLIIFASFPNNYNKNIFAKELAKMVGNEIVDTSSNGQVQWHVVLSKVSASTSVLLLWCNLFYPT